MQFTVAALSLFIAAASAATVGELAAQIPACAQPCIQAASQSVGCNPTDLKCQCTKADDLQAAGLECVLTNCSDVDQLNTTLDISTQLCALIAAGGVDGQISSYVSSVLAGATSAPAASGASTTGASTTGASTTGTHTTGTSVTTTPAATVATTGTSSTPAPTAGAVRNSAAGLLGVAAAVMAFAI